MQQRQEMLLPPVDASHYNVISKEPQYVTAKNPQTVGFYIDSIDAIDMANNTWLFAAQPNYGVTFSRLGLRSFSANTYIENVNERNNTLTFHVEPALGVPTEHTVTIPPGLYDDIEVLRDAILLAMNDAAGADTFEAVPLAPLTPRQFGIMTVGGITEFRVDPNCTFCTKGIPMFGDNSRQVSDTSQTFGPIGFTYTNYIDVVSTELTQYRKIQSMSTNRLGQLVLRAQVPRNLYGESFKYFPGDYIAFPWRHDTPLSTFRISMYDENGDPLYLGQSGFMLWSLECSFEM